MQVWMASDLGELSTGWVLAGDHDRVFQTRPGAHFRGGRLPKKP